MSIVVDESDDPSLDLALEEPSIEIRDIKIRKDKWVSDEFEVLDFLGRGKFGEVKRCKEKSTGKYFAAKFILTSTNSERAEVEHEVAIMNKLRHKRLLQLYDAFACRDQMCLILELIHGGELFDRVIDDDFILTEKACQVFMRQICEGVDYMHSINILHLDMKPENILCLTKTGNRIKIIDFGLAREYSNRKDLRVLFGTPEFMAPEVISYEPIDCSTDMWSIGVITYVLLSGLSPFMGDNDAETLSNVMKGTFDFDYAEFSNVSEEAKDMIRKLLIKDRRKRLTARQCLESSWLRVQRPNFNANKHKDFSLELSKKRLRRFQIRRRWQKMVNVLIALKRMGVCLSTIPRCSWTSSNIRYQFPNGINAINTRPVELHHDISYLSIKSDIDTRKNLPNTEL